MSKENEYDYEFCAYVIGEEAKLGATRQGNFECVAKLR
jgi:hypothetical protein